MSFRSFAVRSWRAGFFSLCSRRKGGLSWRPRCATPSWRRIGPRTSCDEIALVRRGHLRRPGGAYLCLSSASLSETWVILMVSKASPSETVVWWARAAQARRVAGMLSPRDAQLAEAHALECEDNARETSAGGVQQGRSVSCPMRSIESFSPMAPPLRNGALLVGSEMD
jgi:hypothetical protein